MYKYSPSSKDYWKKDNFKDFLIFRDILFFKEVTYLSIIEILFYKEIQKFIQKF